MVEVACLQRDAVHPVPDEPALLRALELGAGVVLAPGTTQLEDGSRFVGENCAVDQVKDRGHEAGVQDANRYQTARLEEATPSQVAMRADARKNAHATDTAFLFCISHRVRRRRSSRLGYDLTVLMDPPIGELRSHHAEGLRVGETRRTGRPTSVG